MRFMKVHFYLKFIMSQVKVDKHVDITDFVVKVTDLVVVQLEMVQLHHVVDPGGYLRQSVVAQIQFRHPR